MTDAHGLPSAHVVVGGGGIGIGRAIGSAPVDMTDEPGVAAWAAGLGPVDHLVISASSAIHGPFAGVETAALKAMFDAKFFGPYATARAILPGIPEGGSITFFSGILSRRPGLNCSGLGAVNAAIEGLTRALALELGPAVRVNCCSPGMVRSDAYAAMDEGRREHMYRTTGESLPVDRIGETAEIAQAVLFLMTNGYATGVVLDVDGGNMVRQYATR